MIDINRFTNSHQLKLDGYTDPKILMKKLNSERQIF